MWVPLRMTAAEREGATSHNYTVVARLADGVSFERASGELAAFTARMAAAHPESHRAIGARLVPLGEQTVRAIRPALLVIGGGVALLLLVACANAATLLIARAASRRHEIAVRAALGASRRRLLSQAVAECLVYSALGGVSGLIVGRWACAACCRCSARACRRHSPSTSTHARCCSPRRRRSFSAWSSDA